MINVHTHIFNVKCAPDRFYGAPIAKLLSVMPFAGRRLARGLRILWPFSSRDMLDRYAKMLEIGIEKRQLDIFVRLLDYYSHYHQPKIVALTLDMDYMGAGDAVNNYVTQLKEVAEVKARYPDQLIAFFCVDPRRPNVLNLLKDHVLNKGFSGIKLYPALGFFPFDPRLRPVYEFAAEQDLPILSHCDIGGIYYRGPLMGEHITPASLNPAVQRRNFLPHVEKKRSKYKDFFTDPTNFEDVLSMPEFSNLRVCLAHYGGSEMIAGKGNLSLTSTNWYTSIRNMMLRYPGVYTDVSYTLHNTNKTVRTPVMNDIRDAQLGKKILFGTDYYMTVREKAEQTLVDDFIKGYGLTESELQMIAVENNKTFLKTKLYTP